MEAKGGQVYDIIYAYNHKLVLKINSKTEFFSCFFLIYIKIEFQKNIW